MNSLSRSGGSISRRQGEGICFLGWHRSAGSPCRAQCVAFCGAIAPRRLPATHPSSPSSHPSSPAAHSSSPTAGGISLCRGSSSLSASPLIACVCTSPQGLGEQGSENDHRSLRPETGFFFFFNCFFFYYATHFSGQYFLFDFPVSPALHNPFSA